MHDATMGEIGARCRCRSGKIKTVWPRSELRSDTARSTKCLVPGSRGASLTRGGDAVAAGLRCSPDDAAGSGRAPSCAIADPRPRRPPRAEPEDGRQMAAAHHDHGLADGTTSAAQHRPDRGRGGDRRRVPATRPAASGRCPGLPARDDPQALPQRPAPSPRDASRPSKAIRHDRCLGARTILPASPVRCFAGQPSCSTFRVGQVATGYDRCEGGMPPYRRSAIMLCGAAASTLTCMRPSSR